MGSPKASSVAPLNPMLSPGSRELEPDQSADRRADQAADRPRDFHFAVTWVALFAHLDPIEALGPSEAAVRVRR